MCRPKKEKINWDEDLPAELVPPPPGDMPQLNLENLPLLGMVPFVAVDILEDSSDESVDSMGAQAEDSTVSSSDGGKTESLGSMSSDSEVDENEEPLVISSCLNDPNVVWPSESDSESDDDMDVTTGSANESGPLVGSSSSAVRGHFTRGRNMARRSRPFRG